MDEREKKIRKIEQFLKEAKNVIHSAEQVLRSLAAEEKGEKISDNIDTGVEGIFNGEKMTDKNGQVYDIPENYVSKSKLIKGDVLKMTLGADGNNIFKQISKTGRKKVQGKVINEGNFYKIFAEGNSYKISNAAVAFYKLADNDEVEIIIPLEGESEWAAVERKVNVGIVEGQKTETETGESGISEISVSNEKVEDKAENSPGVISDDVAVPVPLEEEKTNSDTGTKSMVEPSDIDKTGNMPTEKDSLIIEPKTEESTTAALNTLGTGIESEDEVKIHDIKTETNIFQKPQEENPQSSSQTINPIEVKKELAGPDQPPKMDETQKGYDLDNEEEEVVYQEDHNDSGELSTFHNQEQNQSEDQELAKDILDRPSNNTENTTADTVGQGVKELDI